jgi:hypothetical protein
MPAKKSFKDDIVGADKIFSANDVSDDRKDNNISNRKNINKNNKYDEILSNIQEDPKGKTCTFYLSPEVVSVLTSTAKKKKISNSKLVDSILKQVLLGEI